MSVVQLQQRQADQQSTIVTGLILAALLLIFWFIKMHNPEKPIEDAIDGVVIDFGDNKYGLGDDNLKEAGGQNSTPAAVQPTPSQPTPQVTPIASTPVKTPPNNQVIAEDPNAVAIAQQLKEEKIRKQKELLEQQKIAEAIKAAEAKRLAEEAAIKAAKDKAQAAITKGKNGNGNGTGNANGNGNGNGQGNTKPGGNQGAQWGTPGGDPNGTGNGNNGTGPGSGELNVTGRKWRDRKQPFNSTNKEGKVVVQIKVDKEGNIVYAKGGAAGSTTTDSYLVSIAEQAARASKLTASFATAEEQFGTITYRFTNSE
ncbi:MAG: hypothetical protein U0U67_11235 [Chitinophagales bacterium]